MGCAEPVTEESGRLYTPQAYPKPRSLHAEEPSCSFERMQRLERRPEKRIHNLINFWVYRQLLRVFLPFVLLPHGYNKPFANIVFILQFIKKNQIKKQLNISKRFTQRI